MPNSQTYILLFDGVCNLCNRAVLFVIKRDVRKRFRFAALQSSSGQALLQELGLPAQHFDSVILIQDDKYFVKSTAALCVLKELGGLWKLCYALIIIPRPIRDFVYDMVARTRYRIFGMRNECINPNIPINRDYSRTIN